MTAAAPASRLRSVAFVGAGSMGAHMARHARRGGFDVAICDVDDAVRASFAAEGVMTASTPDQLGGIDVVFILVATPDQLHDVVSGPSGLSAIASDRAPRFVVVSSTVAPRDIAAVASAAQWRLVDAPVSGGVVAAERGTLTFLAGGDHADVTALTPLFETMGRAVVHCGLLGAGQRVKAINNVIAIANLLISAEAYSIALANGLTLEALMPALEAGSARNFLSRSSDDPPAVYGAWSRDAAIFESVRAINTKDIELALELAPATQDLPTVRSVLDLVRGCDENTRALWQAIAEAGAPG